MVKVTSLNALARGLVVGLALLCWPRMGFAAGNWSVIATYGDDLGHVDGRTAVAADAAGNLYIAEERNRRIQKRDGQGNWSLIVAYGKDLSEIDLPSALAVDATGNLYVSGWH